MTGIVEFLLARIADDEAAARAAGASVWSGPFPSRAVEVAPGVFDLEHNEVAACLNMSHAHHVIRWDPARVLAECALKRTLLEDLIQCYGSGDMATPVHPHEVASIQHMAAIYADHPDYDPAWKVS